MGKGSENVIDKKIPNESIALNESVMNTYFTWSEISKHNKRDDCWVVIHDNVYNVSKFRRIHPGGSRILDLYAGQDATVSLAFSVLY